MKALEALAPVLGALLAVTHGGVARAHDHAGHVDQGSQQSEDSRYAEHAEQHASHGSGPVLPAITDADRAAAFPAVSGHAVHDRAVHFFVLGDQLEWQDADAGSALAWDMKGWVGRDLHRLWLRAEGEREDGRTTESDAHLLWGRRISRWWELVAGARHDFGPGPSRSFAAVGLQGLAPYWFEIEATAYFGEGGRSAARVEAEYELLLTNRWILQPLIEIDWYGESDIDRGLGAGLSSIEGGLRLRYEIRRELAPYIGLTWGRKLGRTADLAELNGEDSSEARAVAGVRIWF